MLLREKEVALEWLFSAGLQRAFPSDLQGRGHKCGTAAKRGPSAGGWEGGGQIPSSQAADWDSCLGKHTSNQMNERFDK